MIAVDIPGYGTVKIEHLVSDYNGTLAVDGELIEGVGSCLTKLAEHLEIHVVTADTFGKVNARMADLPVTISILPPGDQAAGKLEFIRKLGAGRVAAAGNGRNDRLMLKEAALGLCVILDEGAALQTLQSADVVFTDIIHALEFLNAPLRMTATLRS